MPSALFINDYSFHGQFSSPDAVIVALRKLRSLRAICRKYSIECFCSRIMLGNRNAISDISLRKVITKYPNADIRRLVLAWLDKHGPYWDTARIHDASDWYFVIQGDNEKLATDSAVAECAARVLLDQQNSGLLSTMPSDFTFTPIIAGIRNDTETTAICELPNHWEETSLRQFLGNSISVNNWSELRVHVIQRFSELIFSEDAFAPLIRTPFSIGLRDRILELLNTLNQISAGANAETCALNNEAELLKEKFFTGAKALFTNSSNPEKLTFKTGLTFQCPITSDSKLFPWHGKIKMGAQYRIHFGWPKLDTAHGLPVVYIGPKITKR